MVSTGEVNDIDSEAGLEEVEVKSKVVEKRTRDEFEGKALDSIGTDVKLSTNVTPSGEDSEWGNEEGSSDGEKNVHRSLRRINSQGCSRVFIIQGMMY